MRNCSEEAKTTPGARASGGLGPHSLWELELRWSRQLKLDIPSPMPTDMLSCGEFSSDLTYSQYIKSILSNLINHFI